VKARRASKCVAPPKISQTIVAITRPEEQRNLADRCDAAVEEEDQHNHQRAGNGLLL